MVRDTETGLTLLSPMEKERFHDAAERLGIDLARPATEMALIKLVLAESAKAFGDEPAMKLIAAVFETPEAPLPKPRPRLTVLPGGKAKN